MTAQITIFPSTASPREWWAIEARRGGSDWISIAEVVSSILHRLAAASSSGARL